MTASTPLLRLMSVVVLLCSATFATAVEIPKLPDAIRQAMQDRDYTKAIEAIDRAGDSEVPADYLLYLKGRAQYLDGKYDDAIETFGLVELKYPKSARSRRARLSTAAAYVRKRDYKSAEEIYKGEAHALLSIERKTEIASIYLEFAEAYYEPAGEDDKPDYKKALDFFEKSLGIGPAPEQRTKIELQIARCRQELGKHNEAIAGYTKFIKQYPDSDLLVEARYRLGQTYLTTGNRKQARRSWEDMLSGHASSKSDRLPEGSFLLAGTFGLPSPANDEDLNRGVARLVAFLKKYPDHKRAPDAYLQMAQSYMARNRFEPAVERLQTFLADKRYAGTEQLPQGRVLLGRCYQMQKKYDEAITAWRQFLTNHPTHGQWSTIQKAIIDTEYFKAQEQLTEKKYAGARTIWQEFLVKYPLDPRSPRILFQFGSMQFAQKKWDGAITQWRRLVSKYPGTNESSQGQFMIGATLEEHLDKLDEALVEYKKVTWGSHAGQARQRIARLTQDRMEIATTRVFRSDEAAKIRLTSRNIEEVKVRVYRVDLETYFRKMHLARGIESLDISLIDPDTDIDFKLPKYREYQQTEHDIEVTLPEMDDAEKNAGSAVMAVTVSSPKLEATTLVLRSDLDMVVKSSRDEVFVFAQNMLTGRPYPGAKVLVSNGTDVFAEGTTDDQGIYRGLHDELHSSGDVRVFAIADGHVASNVVNLQGVSVARGLAAKGYVYTERPAYRPGQLVHIRGLVRTVADDQYVVPKDKTYRLDVFDTRSRPIHHDKVKLGEFGSFHINFSLPESSPLGQYRVVLHDEEKESYQGTFTVHQYQLEPIRIEVEADRTVYYRGEQIEGKIKLRYEYGAPLADREIRYSLAGGSVTTARTDAKGFVSFKLETRDFRESQPLPLIAQFPERNLQGGKVFMLATQGFSITPSLIRPVQLAGETFEVKVETKSAENKPVSQRLTIHVLERTNVNGKVGERLVEKHEIETGDEEGIGRQTLKIAKGGTYVLRVEGTDRFKNPISGVTTVQISDDSDAVRLRILADRHSYKVGDTAKVQLHWRNKPALALVTFQGARILDYRLVNLKKGNNLIEIPMAAKLAPNFHLAVAVMTDPRDDSKSSKQAVVARRFHTADSPFVVQRDLNVSVKIVRADGKPGNPRPGEEARVIVTTTDPQGAPVTAELSLALVERSLLERYASPLGAIGAFFRGTDRQTAVRTTSSVTFGYRPTTKGINKLLLSERERLAVEELERESLADSDELVDDILDTVEAVTWDTDANGIADDSILSVDMFAAPGQPTDQESSQRGRSRALGRMSRQAGGRLGGMGGGAGLGNRLSRLKDKKEGEARQMLLSRGAVTNERINESLAFGYFAEDAPANAPQLAQQPTSGLFRSYAKRKQVDFKALNSHGEFFSLNLRNELGTNLDANKIDQLVSRLATNGTILLAGTASPETAYWNPSVITDEKGTATLTITLPERSTAWKLVAKGITEETLAGESDQELEVSKRLFGQLKLPLAFVSGDTSHISATVHNDLVDQGKLKVTLRTTIGGRTVSDEKLIPVKAKGVHEVTFATKLDLSKSARVTGENVSFELVVEANDYSDTARRTLPLLPAGMPVYALASGSGTSDATVIVETPEGMVFEQPRLQILLGPTIEQSLLDVVFASAPQVQVDSLHFGGVTDRAVSDLMATLALEKLIADSHEKLAPQAQSLDNRIRSGIGQLASFQNDDGGWSWTGRGASSPFSTARALWGLQLATRAGYRVSDDARNKAINYLQTQLTKTKVADYESKAILLHCMTVAGKADFPLANQLYRNRQNLSPAGLIYLTLTFAEMKRKQTASELLSLVKESSLDQSVPVKPEPRSASRRKLTWNNSGVELRALYALAITKINPADPRLQQQVDFLMAHRTGHRWAPDKATGPAMLVACQWYSRTKFEGQKYQLSIYVNDRLLSKVNVDDTSRTQTLDVPNKLLSGKARQQVRFEVVGRGRYSYQCVLSGFVPSEKLSSTTKNWTIDRIHQPAPLEVDGREIPRGFGIVQGNYSHFRNSITQLPVAKRAQIELHVRRHNLQRDMNGATDERLEYLVVTEPLPAGTAVVEKSIKGGFERYELSPGSITFHVGTRRYIEPIRYNLHGYLPGKYQTLRTVVRDAYAADRMAVSEAKPIEVLALGAKSKDVYRLTPQELYELGNIHFKKHEYDLAAEHLAGLLAGWNVRPNNYKEVVRMLLDIHLESGSADDVVRYFEILTEKYPELEISFAKLLKVGQAYHEIGEYERSYLVFRATLETSFMRESQVAGFLQGQGEFVRSVDVMGSLLLDYPPEPYVATATYALAQQVFAMAPTAAKDPKLREAKITRVDLVRQSLDMIDNFLSTNPDDPAADEASFSLASGLLELKAYPQTIAACTRYAARYPKSDFLDSYWYIMGYCHFARGEHTEALKMCRKVAEAKRTDAATGRVVESENKWRAIYILGQIYHSLGSAAQAITEYEQVKDRFVDARQAIEYFARKDISLPEISTFRPGEPVSVELGFRNVKTCDTKVYRIDLMKFSLLQRNLGGITKINLSGIRPLHETTVQLGDGKDYRDRKNKLELPLEKQGAYLIVSRSENLHASGLVLISPLAVEVNEDPVSGRVRTTVRDVVADKYASDVHVKVIGTNNPDFVSGASDLRGVFVADAIAGISTVIAQASDDRYAFFRGKLALGTPAVERDKNIRRQGASKSKSPQKQEDLLEQIRGSNYKIQTGNQLQLQQLYDNSIKGGAGAGKVFK